MQAALDYANNLDDIKPTDEFRRNLCISLGQAFMKSAEWADEPQAEKDLELSWKDIEIIQEMANKYCKYHSCEPRFFVYSEILKRFKNMKDGGKG